MFCELIALLDSGNAVTEADAKLKQVIASVNELQQAGKLQLTLSISPIPGNRGRVEIEYAVAVRKPEPDHSDVFDVSQLGDLTAHRKQGELGI